MLRFVQVTRPEFDVIVVKKTADTVKKLLSSEEKYSGDLYVGIFFMNIQRNVDVDLLNLGKRQNLSAFNSAGEETVCPSDKKEFQEKMQKLSFNKTEGQNF